MNQEIERSNGSNKEFVEEIKAASQLFEQMLGAFSGYVVGQSHVAKRLLMALLADGHVLLEGLPGLAKTTSIKTMASLTGLKFARIQFTPDLLPADVTGTQIYDPRSASFSTRKGPVFTNLLLADEINRAPAKVQSALLEAMQEHQVTIGGETHTLEQPFLVMATQNPVEQEGTYPLPEAQVDRFMFKVRVGYGTMDDEKAMLKLAATNQWSKAPKSLLSRSEIITLRQVVGKIHVSEKIHQYIVNLVFASRDPEKFHLSQLKPWIEIGASPRASLYLEKAARVNALMLGRDFVIPQDIKDVAADVLRHRITLTFSAESEQITTGKSRRVIAQKRHGSLTRAESWENL